jgi:uncharacterized membrane protein
MGVRTTVENSLLSSRHPRKRGSERAGRRRPAHRAAVGLLTALVAALYSGFALAQYYTFRDSSYDLVIFDEAVRSYSRFEPGISIIKGLHNGFGPNFSVLGDHWSPILASLAPLYWIYDSPETLLVAQAVLFALAIPWLWVFTRRAFGDGQKATAAAYLVCVAYALSWPIASALAFDFHEVAFAPVLTAIALERLQAGRLRAALVALGALLLVKEDMGLLVAGIGIYLAVARPRTLNRQLLVGLGLIVAGALAAWISTDVLIPAFGGDANYYWAYQDLGSGVAQAAVHLLVHPISSLRLLMTPRVKLDTMLWLVGAFCFLSLRSPMALAAVPLLLERMLGDKFPAWWGTTDQYNAYLVVILICAAVDGAARLDRTLTARRAGPRERPAERPGEETAGTRPGEPPTTSAGTGPAVAPRAPDSTRQAPALRGTGSVALACAAAMCTVALILVPRFAFGPSLHPTFYQRDANMKAAAAADAVVPSGVTVQAVDNLGPELSGRDTVLLWDGDGHTPATGAPWIVASISARQFTFSSLLEQKQRIALLERSGYKIVFERGGYLVLHRAGQGGDPAKADPG